MIEPVLFLAGVPEAPAGIPDLFRGDEVRALIERPEVTRHNGFNILTYERAKVVEGKSFVIDAWRKRLELHADGTFLGLGTFSEFLGWPRDHEEFMQNPKVNSLALIEFTYEFFSAYSRILTHVKPLPVPVSCRIGIRNAHFGDGQRLWMAPYALNTVGYDHPLSRNYAPAPEVEREVHVEASTDDPHIEPATVTYALIEQLYNWVGLDSLTVPYANHDNRVIDPATF